MDGLHVTIKAAHIGCIALNSPTPKYIDKDLHMEYTKNAYRTILDQWTMYRAHRSGQTYRTPRSDIEEKDFNVADILDPDYYGEDYVKEVRERFNKKAKLRKAFD